jgi:hypothetical protein
MISRDLPGWDPLPGHSLPYPGAPSLLRELARRWAWPAATIAGFLALAGWVISHDDPAPGLSDRGYLTLALAGLVAILLSRHRARGRLLAATAEYALIGLLAALLATAATSGHPQAHHPARHPSRAAEASARRPPAPLPIRAVTGTYRWLADLWHQATRQADRPAPPSSTARPTPRRALPTPPADLVTARTGTAPQRSPDPSWRSL